MIDCFKPIMAKQPVALIVGSIPSVVSLSKQEYYGFKHNRFWKVMEAYFDVPLNTYDDKKQLIIEHDLALWDIISHCEREGSLDSKITKVVCNDITLMLENYPTIELVICNGKKSYQLFQRYFADLPVICISLPSTSNANRTINEKQLFEQWFKVLDQIYSKRM